MRRERFVMLREAKHQVARIERRGALFVGALMLRRAPDDNFSAEALFYSNIDFHRFERVAPMKWSIIRKADAAMTR